MAGYLMVQGTIDDEEQYQKYRDAVVPLIMKFGGKLSVRGGKVAVLEGQPDTRSMIVFEFPSIEAIHAFWNSAEYVPVKQLRQGAATLNVWAVPGI
jgi:uncharacterized protein (DUF1330 family)